MDAESFCALTVRQKTASFVRDSLRRLGPARLNNLLPYYLFHRCREPALFLTLRCKCVCALHTVQKTKVSCAVFSGCHTETASTRKRQLAASSGKNYVLRTRIRHCLLRCSLRLRRLRRLSAAQRVSRFFLRFVFLSLEHAAFSALQPSMPTRPRLFHPRSTTVHLLSLWLIPHRKRSPVRLFSSSLLCCPLSVRITLYCIRISPCCRRAVLPPCRGRNDRKDGGLVQIDQSDGPRGLGWRFERCRSSAQQRLLREQAKWNCCP